MRAKNARAVAEYCVPAHWPPGKPGARGDARWLVWDAKRQGKWVYGKRRMRRRRDDMKRAKVGAITKLPYGRNTCPMITPQ